MHPTEATPYEHSMWLGIYNFIHSIFPRRAPVRGAEVAGHASYTAALAHWQGWKKR